MASFVYGFDARAPLGADDPTWTADRRDRFLLRPDVRRPLSVDRAVWPAAEFATPTPPWTPGYWRSLGALLEALGESSRKVVVVALTIVDDTSAANVLSAGQPRRPPTDWVSLGFDVADTGLVSAISNCGFVDDQERATLRGRWAGRLNTGGLLSTVADAREYCSEADRRVPEHAPFAVHEILVVPAFAQ
jgi:hypothetical protein